MSNIDKAKNNLVQEIASAESDPYGIVSHTQIVERWANFLLDNHPEADKEITLMGVWLHDIGHYPLDEIDHALRGEERAKRFLNTLNLSPQQKEAIIHCVRAHRCRDVQPETIEAKIVACADSASHFIDFAYLDALMRNKHLDRKYSVMEKVERDYRDISLFPEVKVKLEKLYLRWKELIREFEKINDEL